MRRCCRLIYYIEAPKGYWWVSGKKRPVKYSDMEKNCKEFSSHKRFRTAKRAFGIALTIPGCVVSRWFFKHGKRMLQEWSIRE